MKGRALAISLAAAVLAVAGCGGGGGGESARFPAAGGKSLASILTAAGGAQADAPVLAPAVSVLRAGSNRYGFGLFTASRENVKDVKAVALYLAPGANPDGPAKGPYPVKIESLAVKAPYESKTTRDDPDAAKLVYAAKLRFPGNGPYALGALIRRSDGSIQATGPVGASVKSFPAIPAAGQAAPRISTPTAKSVGGNLAKIDTRDPHDDMHDVNFANVLGHKPIVLVFATPALCQSRVCGPVVDIAEQIKAKYGRRAAFIHMEIYKDNDANKGFRPQLAVYGLQSEPWVFLINRRGRVFKAIEGAVGTGELTAEVGQLVRQ